MRTFNALLCISAACSDIRETKWTNFSLISGSDRATATLHTDKVCSTWHHLVAGGSMQDISTCHREKSAAFIQWCVLHMSMKASGRGKLLAPFPAAGTFPCGRERLQQRGEEMQGHYTPKNSSVMEGGPAWANRVHIRVHTHSVQACPYSDSLCSASVYVTIYTRVGAVVGWYVV